MLTLEDPQATSGPSGSILRCCRERKKAEALSERRKDAAPPVVALLPLSSEVDVPLLWNLILDAFIRPGSDSKQRHCKGADAMDEDAGAGLCHALPRGLHPMLLLGAHTARASCSCNTGDTWKPKWVTYGSIRA